MFMALAILLQLTSAAADVRILNSPQDLPEKFSSLARKGDTIIAGAKLLAVIGGSARPVLNNSNYPISNALGALIGFGPAGLHDPAEVNIGAPIIRINGRPVQIAHASFAQKKGKPGTTAVRRYPAREW